MNNLIRLILLAVYALALAGLAGWLPPGAATMLRNAALVLLLIHVVELVLAFRHVRLYRGPLWISVLLTLLFGLLHWKPLADAQARSAAKSGAEP